MVSDAGDTDADVVLGGTCVQPIAASIAMTRADASLADAIFPGEESPKV